MDNKKTLKGEMKMVSKDRLKQLCGIGIYKNIPVENIKELRVTHNRLRNDCRARIEGIESNGGFTKVDVVIGIRIFSGEAVCSLDDNFCKKTGRDLALIRAFRKYWESLKGRG